MLRLVKDAGKVLLGFANVLRHDQRKVHLVHFSSGGLAEEACGHGLAGAGRPVEERPVTGPQFVAHGPVVHQRAAVAQPDLDLLHLGERAGMQHEIAPVELGFDMAGGKIHAQVGSPDLPGGNEAEALFREP